MSYEMSLENMKAEFPQMFRHQPSPLEKCLLELLDPNTTPKKVLQLLSYDCFSPEGYKKDGLNILSRDDYGEPIELVIFLAHTRFIMTRLPDAIVDGIWEDILWKTVKFSQNLSDTNIALHSFGTGDREIFIPNIFNKIVSTGTEGLEVSTWLEKALSTHCKCPNPYIRLELFRLIRLFKVWFKLVSRESLSITFMHTICEIQPNHLYPSGNVDDALFSAADLYHIIISCCRIENLQKIISFDLINQLKEKNVVIDNSNATRFISHCIKLIGVFAAMAGSNPNRKIKYMELKYCCQVFRKGIGCLVDCGNHLPKMPLWKQFRYVVVQPPFCHYVVETVRDLTAAITNYKHYQYGDVKQTLMSLRDIIAEDLVVSQKTYMLPKLLLSRQVQGPLLVYHHSLLFRNIGQTYEKNSDEDNDVEEKYYEDGHRYDRWSQTAWNLPCDPGEINDESSDELSDNCESCDEFSHSSHYYGSSINYSLSDDSSDDSDHFHESSNSDSFSDDSSNIPLITID